MPNLLSQAIRYATEAHQRIDHRRKYSGQPYSEHLKRVADIVATITDDETMIAAAWLHDVVEDTPATIDQVEREFGAEVASLVGELTDVSTPADGNRARRKAIDREHLAAASANAQTVKLADLIDNCNDIVAHDPRFARVYLDEMAALLEVLTQADGALMKRARKALEKGRTQLARLATSALEAPADAPAQMDFQQHFKHRYNELFTAGDIAEPLLSFDSACPTGDAAEALEQHQRRVATIRSSGDVTGYVLAADLNQHASCGEASRSFAKSQVLAGDAGFAEVIHVLTHHDHCFVSMLGQVHGCICRDDVNKPYMRMWLFGIITLAEMGISTALRNRFAEDDWQPLLPAARLEAAKQLQQERHRMDQPCDLFDCLQLADKGLLMVNDPELLPRLGFKSKRAAKSVFKEFQSLRNNLAHAQDISVYDWAQIARLAKRMLE